MTVTSACKLCNTPIPAEDITDGELAICDRCDTLNNFNLNPVLMPVKTKGHNPARKKFDIEVSPDGGQIDIVPAPHKYSGFFNGFFL